MSRFKPAVACLLLSCLAAAAVAAPHEGRGHKTVSPASAANLQAVYDCPDTPRMKGCAATGCALNMFGRSSALVCAQCANEKAYILANANTRKAQCECAPGYAGKGQDGVCKKCPAGTDIAEGGPITKSVCIKCPKGSYVNADATDCICPAGHYRAVAPEQAPGVKKIACKPCTARGAYVADDGHTHDTCKTCAAPQVANKDHTGCVMPNDEDAAAPGEGLSALANRGPLGSLAAAFEEGRQAAQQQRLMRKADIGTAPSVAAPLKSIASRVHKKQAAVAEDDEEVEVEEEQDQAAAPTAKRHAKEQEEEEEEQEEAVEQQEAEEEVYEAKGHKKRGTSKADYYKYQQAKAKATAEQGEEQEEPAAADSKPAPPKAKPTAGMSQPVDESDAATDKKGAAKKAEKQPAAAKDAAPEQPKAKDATKPPPPKWNGDKVDPNLASQLIPGLAADPEGEGGLPGSAREPTRKEMKALSKQISDEMLAAQPQPPAAAAAPAGPVTFKDLVKKVGAVFGGATPAYNPVASAVGFIDPEALKDAGLPPANNVGELMGSLIKAQLGDLDLGDWRNGIKSGSGSGSMGGFGFN